MMRRSVYDRASAGTWTSFSPSWTGVTTTNATQEAGYSYMPGGMAIVGNLTFGASTAITGAVSLTLPDSASMNTDVVDAFVELGQLTIRDVGVAVYEGSIQYATATSVSFLVWNVAGTYPVATNLSSTVPMTWTTPDTFAYSIFVPI